MCTHHSNMVASPKDLVPRGEKEMRLGCCGSALSINLYTILHMFITFLLIFVWFYIILQLFNITLYISMQFCTVLYICYTILCINRCTHHSNMVASIRECNHTNMDESVMGASVRVHNHTDMVTSVRVRLLSRVGDRPSATILQVQFHFFDFCFVF